MGSWNAGESVTGGQLHENQLKMAIGQSAESYKGCKTYHSTSRRSSSSRQRFREEERKRRRDKLVSKPLRKRAWPMGRGGKTKKFAQERTSGIQEWLLTQKQVAAVSDTHSTIQLRNPCECRLYSLSKILEDPLSLP